MGLTPSLARVVVCMRGAASGYNVAENARALKLFIRGHSFHIHTRRSPRRR